MAKRKYTRRRTKKKKEVIEIVTKCDQCGKLLNRTCARTNMSAICAMAEGIRVLRSRGVLYFFCSWHCEMDRKLTAENKNEDIHSV